MADDPNAEAEAPAGEAPADAAPAPDAAPPDALSGDALLNMFQATQIEEVDRGAVLELAGDVELADLLEELHTVAAALGLSR